MAKVVKRAPRPIENEILSSKELGAWIKHIRTKLMLNRKEAALFCNIAYSTLLNIENGKGTVSIENYLKVASMLGLKLRLED
ncbi:MAG: DNA-binding XRE family transcriptional regulator [Arcobacteraceae bacterium]|jgi:DNA-binding XRE family transcriptional regulator